MCYATTWYDILLIWLLNDCLLTFACYTSNVFELSLGGFCSHNLLCRRPLYLTINLCFFHLNTVALVVILNKRASKIINTFCAMWKLPHNLRSYVDNCRDQQRQYTRTQTDNNRMICSSLASFFCNNTLHCVFYLHALFCIKCNTYFSLLPFPLNKIIFNPI